MCSVFIHETPRENGKQIIETQQREKKKRWGEFYSLQ
jgi:hypothetical protein